MRTTELHAATFDVATLGAAEIQAGHEDTLADRLADAGLTEGQIAEIEEIVEAESERRSFHVAAQTLRRILSLVSSRSTHGAAIAHSLGFGCEASLRELGAQFGHSKQSVGNLVSQIKDALAPVLPDQQWRPVPKPPDRERVWYSQYQVGRYAKVTPSMIKHAATTGALPSVEHDGRHWFDEAHVIAWAATLPPRKVKDAATATERPAEGAVATDGVPVAG